MPVVALGLAKISFILLDSLVFMAPPTAVQMYAQVPQSFLVHVPTPPTSDVFNPPLSNDLFAFFCHPIVSENKL